MKIRNIQTIISREYLTRVKKKSFLLTTFLVPVLFAAMCILPSVIMFMAKDEGKKDVNPNVTLKLKKSDIRLGAYYQFRLELDCDLDPKDVEWSSEHPYVASVDEEGLVTALMKGAATDIIVKYGDQEVRCIVRVT